MVLAEVVAHSAAQVPAWVLVLSSVGSGALVGFFNYVSNRKLRPLQERREALSAEEVAVEIVNTALRVAQGRISSLETQIRTLTERITELRDVVSTSTSDKSRLQSQLDLALTQRAQLQQQLIDLSTLLGEGKSQYLSMVSPPDAIIMVTLESGKICYANDGVFSLFGYAPQELVGQPLDMLVPDAVRSRHHRQVESYAQMPRQRAMGSGIDLVGRRRDSIGVPVDISLHPTGDGRVIALVKRRTEQVDQVRQIQAHADSHADGVNAAQ